MGNILNRTYKTVITKWLLAVALILSLFAISGSAIQPQSDQFRLKTTLVSSARSLPGKTICYSRANALFYNQQASISFFIQQAVDASVLQNSLTKTRIKVLAYLYNNRARVKHYIPTTPQNADDEPAISLI